MPLFQLKKSFCYKISIKQFSFVHSDLSVIIEEFDKDLHKSLISLRSEEVYNDFDRYSKKQKVIVACLNGTVIGHLCMKKPGNNSQGGEWKEKYFIHYGFVSPYYRGHNIYPMLLSFMCVDFFNEVPNGTLYVTTGINNQPAQKSFEKVGFLRYSSLSELYLFGHRVFCCFN